MMVVDLLIQAFAGDGDLVGVDDNYEVATIHVRRKGGFVFATQDLRDLRCYATQDLPLCIDDVPLRLQISGLGAICLHHCSFTPNISGYSTCTRHSPCGGAAEPGCVFSARCTISANSASERRCCPTRSNVPTILRTCPVRKASAVKSQ